MLVDEGKSLKKTQAKMALCCFTNEKLIVEFLLYFHSENPIVFCLDLYNHFQMQSCLIINMVSLVAFFALFYEENQGLYIYIYIPYFVCHWFLCWTPKSFSYQGTVGTFGLSWFNPFGHRSDQSAILG